MSKRTKRRSYPVLDDEVRRILRAAKKSNTMTIAELAEELLVLRETYKTPDRNYGAVCAAFRYYLSQYLTARGREVIVQEMRLLRPPGRNYQPPARNQ